MVEKTAKDSKHKHFGDDSSKQQNFHTLNIRLFKNIFEHDSNNNMFA